MELGEDSSAQRAKGKRERAEKEGREGGREGGKRDGMEEKGREGMRELQVLAPRILNSDCPSRTLLWKAQELVESLAGFVAPMPGLESQFHIHYICNLGQCTPHLIGPSIFIWKLRMVRIVHHWALKRIKLLGTKVLRRVTGTYQVLTAFLCSVWNFLSNETKTSCLWKLLAKCLHDTFHMDL